jgi:exodeoxyribonuclease VII small subunit
MSEVQQDFSLEAKMQELRGILGQMQSGSLDFDTNIKLFTQGNAIIKACRGYLDAAEMSVKVLMADEEVDFEEK